MAAKVSRTAAAGRDAAADAGRAARGREGINRKVQRIDNHMILVDEKDKRDRNER